MKTSKLLAILFLAIFVAACGGKPKTQPDPSGRSTAAGAGSSQSGIDSGTTGDLTTLGGADAASRGPGDAVVYFEFDQSQVQGQYNELLSEHATYLATNPDVVVRLEGNTDERGSREYNIGLGERRAQSVRQVLLIQGVSISQITTVSYGEERPADEGTTDEAYALNRRVEIVY